MKRILLQFYWTNIDWAARLNHISYCFSVTQFRTEYLFFSHSFVSSTYFVQVYIFVLFTLKSKREILLTAPFVIVVWIQKSWIMPSGAKKRKAAKKKKEIESSTSTNNPQGSAFYRRMHSFLLFQFSSLSLDLKLDILSFCWFYFLFFFNVFLVVFFLVLIWLRFLGLCSLFACFYCVCMYMIWLLMDWLIVF